MVHICICFLDVVQITTGDDLNSFSPLDSVLQSLSLPTVVDVSALLSSSQNLLPGPASTSAVAVQTSKQQQQQSTTNVSSQLQLPGPSGTTAVTIQTTSQQQPAITVISDEESSHAATSINIPKLTVSDAVFKQDHALWCTCKYDEAVFLRW